MAWLIASSRLVSAVAVISSVNVVMSTMLISSRKFYGTMISWIFSPASSCVMLPLIEPLVPALNTAALDAICLHTSGHLAFIRERATYLIGGLGRIVDHKRGRASTAKEQPHREVGTQSHGPRLREVAGLPSLSRRVRALLSGEAGRFSLLWIRRAWKSDA